MASILKTDKIEGVTSSGTVQMPEGTIIQYKFQTSSTEVDNSSSSFVSTSVAIAFTPKFANSIIQIHWDGHLRKHASGSGGFGYQLYQDSTALHDVGMDAGNKPWSEFKDETRITTRCVRTISHVAGDTNSRTYTCKFKGYNSELVEVNTSSDSGSNEEIMIVMEIAQ